MATNENGEEYSDNGERAIFFARGVLETVKKLRWVPDLVVCQGWMSAVVPFYMKTAYKEEPSFADAKVVISLHGHQLKNKLSDDFKKAVEFRTASADLLANYNDAFDLTELGKLAIDYSDGVIAADSNVSETLMAYANEKKLPVLSYPGDEQFTAYTDFFQSLL